MRIQTTNQPAQPAEQSNKGCFQCFAAIFVFAFVVSGLTCALFNSHSPSSSSPPAPAFGVESPVVSDEVTLARVDYGPNFTPDSATLQQYASMLDRLDRAFPEDRHQIALSLLKTYPKIKENDPTLKSLLDYGNLMAKTLPEEIQKANRDIKKRRQK